MRAMPLFLLLAACGGADEDDQSRVLSASNAQTDARAGPPPPTPAEAVEMRAAAAALESYYRHLNRGEHRAAWALREHPPGQDHLAFARSFDAYASYNAIVGLPSYPAESDGYLWVDAPVQLWGYRKDGGRFGNVGRVTLRRPLHGGGAWKIVP
jgi:hypothetical protein